MNERSWLLSDFDFELPEELIAQYPLDRRDESRLFVINRADGNYTHEQFKSLPEILRDDDLLVFNDSRVIPARIFFRRESGALAEFMLVRRLDESRWLSISNKSARLKTGETLRSIARDDVKIRIRERKDEYFEIETDPVFSEEILGAIGNVPLPPYIRRKPTEADIARYQTVYAKTPGGVAAPTAGLHFTEELLSRLAAKGVERVFVTLDVSWGTFQPVRHDRVEDHDMHTESFNIEDAVAEKINRARKDGRRVIAVGTTSLRVLESTYRDGTTVPGRGETSIFIYPPYHVKSVDALITNFHTPKSTLLMLVAAFAGYERIMDAYRTAVRERYRFFSYGDAMFIQ